MLGGGGGGDMLVGLMLAVFCLCLLFGFCRAVKKEGMMGCGHVIDFRSTFWPSSFAFVCFDRLAILHFPRDVTRVTNGSASSRRLARERPVVGTGDISLFLCVGRISVFYCGGEWRPCLCVYS